MNLIHAGRFKDAPWFPKAETEVIVGGAGGIGSWLTLLLARLAIDNIVVYDFDTLEEHNMSGQCYPTSAIGQPKVTALHGLVKSFADTDITQMLEKVTPDSFGTNFMFGAFDNMTARAAIFEVWTKFVGSWREVKAKVEAGETTWEAEEMSPDEPIYIDGRLRLEQFQIFCITADDEKIKQYTEEQLFPDTDVPDEECTLKQSSHTAAMIGGHMVGFFTNHLYNVNTGSEARTVPYEFNYLTPFNFSN